jgi:hypothetical protein
MNIKFGKRFLRRFLFSSLIAGGLYLSGCSQANAYGPPSCDTDDDCKGWLNHCDAAGYCEHVDTGGGVPDSGTGE